MLFDFGLHKLRLAIRQAVHFELHVADYCDTVLQLLYVSPQPHSVILHFKT